MTSSGTIDALIKELGDCGLFQIFIVFAVHGASAPMEWAQIFMSYGNYDPGWTCKDTPPSNSSNSTAHNNTSRETLPAVYKTIQDNSSFKYHFMTGSCDAYRKCSNIVYSTESSTVVTEWGLSCDKSWITSLMLSVQGGGFIIGTYFGGFFCNRLGRKPTHFLGMALHAALNLIAIFSIDWPMFTVMRLLIGVTSGSISVSYFVYPLEFVTDKWRALISTMPFSNTSTLLFSVAALILKDWRQLHLVTFVLTIFWCSFVVCSPESVRWLASKGKTEKAVSVVLKMAKINRKKPPENMNIIFSIAEEENKIGKISSGYTIADLFRYGLMKRTIIITYNWIWVFTCYTVVMFGIKSLSGDFYLNLILFSLISVVGLPFVAVTTAFVGRKWSSVLVLGMGSALCVGLVSLQFVPRSSVTNNLFLALSVMFVVVIEGQWGISMLYSTELYPTGLRSLSISFTVCVGRIGGLVAPFLIPHDEKTKFVSYLVLAVMTIVAWVSVLFLKETKGRPLEDYLVMEGEVIGDHDATGAN